MENTVIDTGEELVNTLGLEVFDLLGIPTQIADSDLSAPLKFDVQLDHVQYFTRPDGQVPAIRGRLAKGKASVTISELADHVEHGRSFTPAIYVGGVQQEVNWQSQQVFALDFDSGIPLKDVMERAAALGVTPNVVYSTFRDTPECPRFRLLFVLTNAVSDYDLPPISDPPKLRGSPGFGPSPQCRSGGRP